MPLKNLIPILFTITLFLLIKTHYLSLLENLARYINTLPTSGISDRPKFLKVLDEQNANFKKASNAEKYKILKMIDLVEQVRGEGKGHAHDHVEFTTETAPVVTTSFDGFNEDVTTEELDTSSSSSSNSNKNCPIQKAPINSFPPKPFISYPDISTFQLRSLIEYASGHTTGAIQQETGLKDIFISEMDDVWENRTLVYAVNSRGDMSEKHEKNVEVMKKNGCLIMMRDPGKIIRVRGVLGCQKIKALQGVKISHHLVHPKTPSQYSLRHGLQLQKILFLS